MCAKGVACWGAPREGENLEVGTRMRQERQRCQMPKAKFPSYSSVGGMFPRQEEIKHQPPLRALLQACRACNSHKENTKKGKQESNDHPYFYHS